MKFALDLSTAIGKTLKCREGLDKSKINCESLEICLKIDFHFTGKI